MLRLNKLEVRHVRGIAGNGPDLVLGGKSLILLGDNATGKSSYIDALEYLLTRQCTSLDINRDGVSWEDGGLHILARAADLSIKGELIDDANAIYPIDHRTDLQSVAAPLKGWIKAAQQRCFLLRRRTLLRLIEARPKERYEALAPFFALDRFGTFETSLRSLGDELESRAEAASRIAITQEEALRRSFGVAFGVTVDLTLLIGIVNQRLATAGKAPVGDLASAARVQAEVAVEMQTFSGVEQVAKLESLISTLNATPPLTPAIQALESLASLKANLEELEKRLTPGFSLEVLQHGKTWISEGNLQHCPLCEQSLTDKAAILSRLDVRLQECSSILETRSSATTQFQLFSDSITEVGEACASGQKMCTERLGQEPVNLSAILTTLREVAKEMKGGMPSAERLRGQLVTLKGLDLNGVISSLVD